MAKFRFKLETLRQFRIGEAEEAKLAFSQAQRSRFEMEDFLLELALRRRESLNESSISGYQDRLALQNWMDNLDVQQQHGEAALMVLLDEEEACRQLWYERQQAADALEKLRVRHRQEFELEQSRREQAQLDEWAVMRRRSA